MFMKVLLESERHIGKNPLDFLQTNHIQNGQYVSIGYLEEETLSTKRRYINQDNDKKLEDIANKNGERFNRDFQNVRKGIKYQRALNGETTTGDFELDPVHILKLGRYNFQWKNAEKKRDDYENKELPLQHAIRKHYGFTSFESEYEFDEDDWHLKKNKNGKSLYKGPSIYPEVEPEDSENGLGWNPIGGEGADFFEHENTHNISFRQVLNKSNMREYNFYYVREDDGILEPLDKAAYYVLKEEFKKQDIEKACDDLLDDERMFLEDMKEFGKRFLHRTFNWEKILYMVASTVGVDSETGKKIYEPFLWINDEYLMETYPYINKECLEQLLQDSINKSKKNLEEWKKTPQVWENKKCLSNTKKQLYECIMQDVSNKVKKQLNILNESSNGWDEEEMSELSNLLNDCYDLQYELQSCVRGAYTKCETYKQLSDYLRDLGERFEEQASYYETLDGPFEDEEEDI